MAKLSFSDHDLYYADVGSGQPIILIHDLGSCGLAWARQMPFLRQAGYRVIVPDLPGHGASSYPDRALDVRELAGSLQFLLDYLGLESAALVGISLGSAIALTIALDAPARVGKLVVCNGFSNLVDDDFVRRFEFWKCGFARDDGASRWFEEMWPLMVSAEFAQSEAGEIAYQIGHARAATTDSAQLARLCIGIANYDVRRRLNLVRSETLVLQSEDGSIFPATEGQRLAAMIPGARYGTLPGGGHHANLDRAGAFNWAVLRFLGGSNAV
ncbi:alpha/beta fold hydrolase [Burkholderia vietnamiensis]|jgi:pimeloyl-ACP methyl ester carboxylesterase|uniref:alpha/beta fold hydrolase n=2 Tax=Burkholderia vietnamiensis TaxID=60552 RepID=UPI000751E08B|nr:alpha/beta hydrolase [Burkholderia vietnamiensis]TPQ44483.1 alpha/beta hydrolase [Burkholderia ubonensis]AOJ16269.1 alpha/beta hydrolase [Burkholderia vietnamiensis]KVE52601.1 alpha/beta hydrolase [Burkholderia vietnamiensis]KVE66411.1 alpha/beta hydrolase [Burkholderia vietnamiensis]KVE79041.1 alpha/beta hydrolase [Burkholderia vietnamiensis]